MLNLHRYRGIRKVGLHAAVSTLTYLATMLYRVKAGDLADIGQMRIPLPVSRAQGPRPQPEPATLDMATVIGCQ